MSNDVNVNVDELRRFAAMAPMRSDVVHRRIASQHFIRHIKTFDTFHASKRDAEYYSERRWALSHFRSNRERARALRERCLRNSQRHHLKHCANVRAERRLRGWLGWDVLQRLCWSDDAAGLLLFGGDDSNGAPNS